MQIRTFVKDGVCRVEVIDASDGAVTHTDEVNEGQQCIVSVPGAHSASDLEFGGVEAIPAAEGEGTEPPAGEGTGTETPTEGEGAGQGDGTTEPEPQTSSVSELPLYRVLADTVPEGFTGAGLRTPDGFALYCYSGDTAGQPHTFEVGDESDVALYAEADDNEQPVIPDPEATEGEAAQTPAPAEGAESPADGEQSA